MSDELKQLVEQGNRAFEEFKKINDDRAKRTESEVREMAEKAFADMTALKERIDTFEAKANRPQIGGEPADQAQVEHKTAFSSYLRKGVEFDKSLEVKALATGTNSGADGGYAVPKVIDSMIENFVVNVSPMRSVASVVQISTPDYHKIVNLRGTASGWVGETDARTATNTPTIKEVVPTMGDLYANPQATQRMLDDVFFNAEQWLAENVGLEFARAEGEAFITGDGSNKPTGFLNGTINTTEDATRAFGAIQYVPTGAAGAFNVGSGKYPADCLFAALGKLKAPYRQNAAWMTNKAALFQIAAFKDENGRYLFDFSTVPGKPNALLGYPVVEAEDMPAIAANSYSIAVADWRRAYLIVDRVGTRVVRDPFSNKPYIGFYTVKRVGGALVNSEAIKVVKFAAS